MSRETLELFNKLLEAMTLSAGAPDFEEWAMRIIQARKELYQELKELDKPTLQIKTPTVN